MDEAALGAELLGDRVDEGGRVVVGDALDLRDALRRRHLDLGADRLDGVRRNRPELGERVERGELDLEPRRKLPLVRPDPGHGWTGVAGNHWTQSRGPDPGPPN